MCETLARQLSPLRDKSVNCRRKTIRSEEHSRRSPVRISLLVDETRAPIRVALPVVNPDRHPRVHLLQLRVVDETVRLGNAAAACRDGRRGAHAGLVEHTQGGQVGDVFEDFAGDDNARVRRWVDDADDGARQAAFAFLVRVVVVLGILCGSALRSSGGGAGSRIGADSWLLRS